MSWRNSARRCSPWSNQPFRKSQTISPARKKYRTLPCKVCLA
ncbi:MAG: hypothetical protein F4Z85_02725 [Gemmatimonadetes bacterium]|nr:hypothetical protein [Gemmatimonadota bacterium]